MTWERERVTFESLHSCFVVLVINVVVVVIVDFDVVVNVVDVVIVVVVVVNVVDVVIVVDVVVNVVYVVIVVVVFVNVVYYVVIVVVVVNVVDVVVDGLHRGHELGRFVLAIRTVFVAALSHEQDGHEGEGVNDVFENLNFKMLGIFFSHKIYLSDD